MAEHQYTPYYKEVLAAINATSADIPAQRKAFKQGFSFSEKPFEQQLAIWNYIWKHTDVFRAQVHAFFFLEQFAAKKELHDQLWQTSVLWQEEIDDWGLCDALAKINTKVLETHPDKVYRQLTAWNKDKNLWKRRQSLVSLLYYSRTKKALLPFEQITALIKPLLTDKEYYVQKGVGWALRELHNVYPQKTLRFLRNNIKSISPIAFTIAIEKMSEKKEALKELRK
jgi:3-methyladenine DNA glycosylase AlkD